MPHNRLTHYPLPTSCCVMTGHTENLAYFNAPSATATAATSTNTNTSGSGGNPYPNYLPNLPNANGYGGGAVLHGQVRHNTTPHNTTHCIDATTNLPPSLNTTYYFTITTTLSTTGLQRLSTHPLSKGTVLERFLIDVGDPPRSCPHI